MCWIVVALLWAVLVHYRMLSKEGEQLNKTLEAHGQDYLLVIFAFFT
jgi:hypothetical protein